MGEGTKKGKKTEAKTAEAKATEAKAAEAKAAEAKTVEAKTTEAKAAETEAAGTKSKAGERKLHAAAYCRVSTAKEVQEGSFELQRRYFRERILADGRYELAGIYGDFGISGGSAEKRPDFQRLLADCRRGKIDVIYTKSVSRFARSIADLVESVQMLRQLGVAVIFEREGINTMERSSELLLNILGIIAQEELRSFGENVRLGIEVRHSTGHPTGRVSYGYRRAAQAAATDGAARDSNWIIDEEEAKRVRLAFRLAAEGACYQDIRRDLNALEEESGTGVVWSRDRLRRLLTNVVYKGDVLTGKSYAVRGRKTIRKINHGEHPQYYLEHHHEPIISAEVFERVQSLMSLGLLHSSRGRRREADYGKR